MIGNMFIIDTSEYLSAEGVRSQKNKTLPPNTLCVTCIGTPGLVSITSVPHKQISRLISLVLNDLTYREYLYFALVGLKDMIEKYGSTGATMANLSKGKFELLNIINPAKSVVSNYHEYTECMFDSIRSYQLINKNPPNPRPAPPQTNFRRTGCL
jgi:type I restriction enzyme S subunit